MSGVSVTNNLPALQQAFVRTVQDGITEAVDGLTDALRDGVPRDAVGAPLIEAGVYGKVPGQSGYGDAVSRLESLVAAQPAELLASLHHLTARPSAVLAAPGHLTAAAEIDPRILPEVPDPPYPGGVVANATEWAAENELGATRNPYWMQTAQTYDVAAHFADFAARWKANAGVS